MNIFLKHLLITTLSLALLSCTPAVMSQSMFVLGTTCLINFYNCTEKAAKPAYRAIFERFYEIEARMSVNTDGTEVDAINENAGIRAVGVSEDVFTVIERSLAYAALSDGAFDPTVGPLVKLWGIGMSDMPSVPPQEAIDAALHLIDWRAVQLNKDEQSVFLTRSGMALDLGAIAKGYAADEAARLIEQYRIPQAIINIGGNVLVYGEKPDKKKWRIGIQNPLGERDVSAGVISIAGSRTLVTSGIYERFMEVDGTRYHHILSTANGFPVQNGLLSVTIIAEKSIDADGLSTAIFALGYEKGKALAEAAGVEALFIFDDKSIRATGGVLADFMVTDTSFSIAVF
jgi:thiamine biosynthesis lipoprotein